MSKTHSQGRTLKPIPEVGIQVNQHETGKKNIPASVKTKFTVEALGSRFFLLFSHHIYFTLSNTEKLSFFPAKNTERSSFSRITVGRHSLSL